jgi:hypothetical protein
MKDKMKWWFNGAVGALLFGSGLSIAIECSHIKHSGNDFWLWVIGGTVGIGLALSGVVLLIKAGILEYKMQQENNQD